MPLSAAQITRVRQMTAERDAAGDYPDADIITLADGVAKVVDSEGLAPIDTGYVETYDLYTVAAELWRVKAGEVADEFDFAAEGGEFTRSQKYDNYLKQAARYSSMARYKSSQT